MFRSYRDDWVDIGGVPSHVMTWGGWLNDPFPSGGTIILFMCGAPGLTSFYKTFLEELHMRLQIPVWTICIAGHEIPPLDTGMALPCDKSLYNNVKAQVNHKVAFINKYVPKDLNIIMIGHSFGGKMTLELLKDKELEGRTQRCFLLMPTIERFGDLPRAQFWLKLRNTGLIYLVVLFVWLLSLLPLNLRRKVSEWYFNLRGFKNVDKCCVQAMTDFISTPLIFKNVREVAFDELQAIKDLDVDVLRRISDRTKVFFAVNDYWAPLTHYHSLKMAVPQVQLELLESEFEHAFSLNTSHKMADIIIDNLYENLLNEENVSNHLTEM